MHKRFSVDQLIKIKTKFFTHTQKLIDKEGCVFFKEFIKLIFKEANEIYYIESNKPSYKFAKLSDGNILISNEIENIECLLTPDDVTTMHNFLKKMVMNKKRKPDTQSIQQLLETAFLSGEMDTINGKPYLVYDIETQMTTSDMLKQKFMMAYVIDSVDKKYRYVNFDSLQKFVDYMLNFDGYIVGYNQIWFDNPVCIYNINGTDEMTQALNEKSIDVMVFLQNLIGRRMKLTKVAESLVSTGKTLDSGLEAQQLYEEYEKTGLKSLLEKVKRYCKNDVKMTLYVFLYIMHYKEIHHEEKEYSYSLEDIVARSQKVIRASDQDEKSTISNQSIFDS